MAKKKKLASKKSTGSGADECDCKALCCPEAPIIVLCGLFHPDKGKRLNPKIVNVRLVVQAIFIVV